MYFNTPLDYINYLAKTLDDEIEVATKNIVRASASYPISVETIAQQYGAYYALSATKDLVLDHKAKLIKDEDGE